MKERKKSEELRELLGLEPVSLMIKKSRQRWFGPEMRRYRFLISTSYPYPLKTIHILSVSMVLLWYNYTTSQKNFPRHFRL